MSDARQDFLDSLVPLGITDPRVRDALAAVDRTRFVPDVPADWVYEDGMLPDGVHHSQPLTVARLCALADVGSGERVLEVGTGSGYQTAVLAHLDPVRIVTLEIDPKWAEFARQRLQGFDTVVVRTGDGRAGAPEQGPYDVVIVNAAAPEPPEALFAQVASAGRLIAPVGDGLTQEWQVHERTEEGWRCTTHGPVRFASLR